MEWISIIWVNISEALLKVPDLKGLITTRSVFDENIQCQGEGKFCEEMRDTAKRKDWCSLLTNSIFLNSI